MNFEDNITTSKRGEKQRKCCSDFNAKDSYSLEPKGYAERILESGFCPKCGVWVVTLCKRDFTGRWFYETAKRKKALSLFNQHKADIIGDVIKSIRYGNRSNMGFRYGENKEYKDRNGMTAGIRQYSIDFNGTKELIKQTEY